jgi:hypothetical protein
MQYGQVDLFQAAVEHASTVPFTQNKTTKGSCRPVLVLAVSTPPFLLPLNVRVPCLIIDTNYHI